MRRILLAGLAAGFCAVFGGAVPAAALELNTSIDLDYTYTQENVDDDVNAEVKFNQKYEIKYLTSLTTAYDFIGAVRVEIQDSWFTDQASTSRLAPTLELSAKGSQLAARIAYEAGKSTTDSYLESAETIDYTSSLSFDLEMTPLLWPEVRFKYKRLSDLVYYANENVSNTFELSAIKDIYDLRLEFNFLRDNVDNFLPTRDGSDETKWSAKATYKVALWKMTEFELNYELNETYKEEQTRGVFVTETATYTQTLKTRLRNSLNLGPRATLGSTWEYQYEQDLLALDFDYKLKNKFALELRWDAYDWLRIASEARRETERQAAVSGEDDEQSVTDTIRAGFDWTSLSWLRVAGKAEFRKEGKVAANSGSSVDKLEDDKFELVIRNSFGRYWDLTVAATTQSQRTDDFMTSRETKVKSDLKLRFYNLLVTPTYEASRKNEWDRLYDYPTNQTQIRDAKIRFEYQMQLLDMFRATFTHEYGQKIEDTLDEVLDFERVLQMNEDTGLTIALAEIIRDLRLEGSITRTGSDTAGDPEPELVSLAYVLRLDWKYDRLTVLSSITYNDKGDTFDDVSFNAKATWRGDRLELAGEYQFDRIIKDITEPKDEKRKLNLKLNYKF